MPPLEYFQQTATSAHQKLSIIGRCEEIGFALRIARRDPQSYEVLIFSRDWSEDDVRLTDLPTGGVNFAVDWPYQEWFKAFAKNHGLDLIAGPSDGKPNLAFYEYAADLTRSEANAFLSKWEKERERLSKEAEAILRPFGQSPFTGGGA
jgi:hypothetical protein